MQLHDKQPAVLHTKSTTAALIALGIRCIIIIIILITTTYIYIHTQSTVTLILVGLKQKVITAATAMVVIIISLLQFGLPIISADQVTSCACSTFNLMAIKN